MEQETAERVELVEQNIETIRSDDSTEVAVARAMEQLKHNAEAAFDSYRGNRGWSENLNQFAEDNE